MKLLTVLFALLSLITTAAHADGFSALVSPPRVEVMLQPGQTLRQVLEVSQVGATAGRFRIYTTDWKFSPNGSIDFAEALTPGSCRPWVALERRELSVGPNSKVRFRFEITPPKEAPKTECTFAIMFEGQDTSAVQQGPLNFPVSGRIAVIVYAGMPGTKPELKIVRQFVSADAAKLPTLEIQNSGSLHGRVSGLLTGQDAKGVKLEFTPLTLPILVGETRAISLTANTENGKPAATIHYPVTIKGALEWADKRVPFESTFTEP
jgi:hypothetical protein